MPLVTITIPQDKENTVEKKEELIRGVTELLVKVLNKNPANTMVIIEEISRENWGLNSESLKVRRARLEQAQKV